MGLVDALKGARVRSWLNWWKERIRFQEQAEKDRPPCDRYEESDVVQTFVRDFAELGKEVGTGEGILKRDQRYSLPLLALQ